MVEDDAGSGGQWCGGGDAQCGRDGVEIHIAVDAENTRQVVRGPGSFGHFAECEARGAPLQW